MFRVLLLTLFATGFTARANPASADLFQKGLAAYQNHKYDEAQSDFQKLMTQGPPNPSVFHNLALADFQLGQKAMALALWRKALAVWPHFQPARRARDMMEGRFQMQPFEQDSLSLWVRRALEEISVYEVLWITALLLGLTGWKGIQYLAARRIAVEDEQSLPPFPSLALSFMVALVLCLGLTGLKIADMATARATVVGIDVSMKSLPADDAVKLFGLKSGSEVLVKGRQKDWVQVQNSEGDTGWVKDSDVFVTSKAAL